MQSSRVAKAAWRVCILSRSSSGLAAESTKSVAEVKIPAELAYYAAKRHVGMVDLPTEMKETLDKFILGSGLKGRRLRLFGRRFTDHLKQLSRTDTRGGITSWLALESRRSKQRKLRELKISLNTLNGKLNWNHPVLLGGQVATPSQRTNSVTASNGDQDNAEIELASDPLLNVAYTSKGALVGTHPRNGLRGVIQESPPPTYEEITTATYAATRFPGTFAAIVRVFDELKSRLPDFRPKNLLDFGAGPGTAIWAAQEVWEESPEQVLAVEPSWPMVALGQEIERSRKKAGVFGDCKVRWVSQLPTIKNSDSQENQKRRYDMCVASYVLSEIPETHDRRRIARLLWERTRNMIVFIEPGTPIGAANIQEMRTFILELERKKYSKVMEAMPGYREGEAGKLDADIVARNRLDTAGCHIIAPCPHDGACPMAGKKMWCHFNQRFLRTRAQKVTKIRPEKQHGPRDFQDERFSFVAIQRGWRKESWDASDVTVATNFQQDLSPDDETIEFTPMKNKGQTQYWMPMESESDDDDAESINLPPVDLGKLDPDTRTLIHMSILDGADDDDDAASSPPWEHTSLESLISKLESRAPLDEASNAPMTEDPPVDNFNDFESSKPPSLDLSTSSIAHEDASSVPKPAISSENEDNLQMISENLVPGSTLPESLSDVHVIDWPKVLPDQFSRTMMAARKWSRIIRPPRRRTGHVIIDVCTSPENSEGNHVKKFLIPKAGKLQRHIVARSDMKTFMGRAGFRIAKKTNWGDLWPTSYNANHKVVDL